MARKPSRNRKPNATGRTRNPVPRFVQIPHYMLECEAWRRLSPMAWKCWFVLRRFYNGRNNNGELFISCEDAADLLETSKATAFRALKELEDHGFITCNKRGLSARPRPTSDDSDLSLRSRTATTYWLNDVPRNDAAGNVIPGGASNEFMRWKPSGPKPKRRRKGDNVIHFAVSPMKRHRFTGGTDGAN